MTSTPIHLLSPPEQGTMQARMSPQSGVRDFGALLLAHEASEHARQDRSTPDGQRRPSSQPTPGTLSVHAGGGAMSPAAIAVAPVVESVDAGLASESVELVGLPWRLRANSGLSYLVASAPAEEEPASAVTESPAAGRAERSSSPEARRPLAEVLESDPDRDALPWNEPTGAASEPAKPAAAAVATEEAAGEGMSTAMATPWQARLLRWLPGVGQDGSTAWVRDFRMDPANARDLVESLQALAKEQGVRLDRIVLNGHPIWHSASTPRIPPRG